MSAESALRPPHPDVFLTLLEGGPEGLELLRETARLAGSNQARWLAVHLDLPSHLFYSRIDEARRLEEMRLTEQLGGEMVQLPPSALRGIRSLIALAGERRVTAFVLPQRALRWHERVFGSYRKDLINNRLGIRTCFIPLKPEGIPRRAGLLERPRAAALRSALLLVAAATTVDFIAQPHVDLADLVMVYLLAITIVATRLGRSAALVASLLSVTALDFCFIPPRFTLAVHDGKHLGTFAVMLGVGWVVASLTERIRAQTRLALEREKHTSALNRLSSRLAEGGSEESLRTRVEHYLELELGLRIRLLLTDSMGRLDPSPETAERALAQWVLEHGTPAGKGTEVLPGSEALCLPMAGSERPIGVLVALTGKREDHPDIDLGLLSLFAAQIALALERARMAEERTQARLRAEEEHLKNTLLSSVSHDLRTPLGIITGAATNLISPGPGASPEDQPMLLATIHQEARRLERLVNNLLDLTKLESGQVKVRKEWVPLDEVVGSALNRLEESLRDRKLALEVPELWVPLDPVLFEQVLLNLMDNALKYSPPGSPLRLEASMETGHVRISLSDRGPGIPSGEEERIFEKLFRGREAGKSSGAGLGLAICRAILQAHEGRIWAENIPEGGARFTLLLPVEGAPPSLEEPQP